MYYEGTTKTPITTKHQIQICFTRSRNGVFTDEKERFEILVPIEKGISTASHVTLRNPIDFLEINHGMMRLRENVDIMYFDIHGNEIDNGESVVDIDRINWLDGIKPCLANTEIHKARIRVIKLTNKQKRSWS